MKKLLALSGSLRRDSLNTALLRAAALLAPPGTSVTQFEGVGSLPHFNPDNENDDLPSVAAWRALLADCDGVMIACPEYAHGLPGAFKNALDWVVGCTTLAGKPVALINASARARHAQAHLHEIITTMGWFVVPPASQLIALTGKHHTQHSIAADPVLAGLLRQTMLSLAEAKS